MMTLFQVFILVTVSCLGGFVVGWIANQSWRRKSRSQEELCALRKEVFREYITDDLFTPYSDSRPRS